MVHFKYNDMDYLQRSAVLEDFSSVKDWVLNVLTQLKVVSRETKQIVVSCDEIFSNISRYGYPPDAEDKPVEISLKFDKEPQIFYVTFTDHGTAFNPLEKPTETPADRVKQRIPGGLGLFLVHQFMDNLNYCRKNECNVLTISKKVTQESA